ncbi:MAG: Lon protease family protein [Armatimonadota bacterium]|jgi:lon-related putative ATP-dependent protease
MTDTHRLSAEQCRWRCDPAQFDFETTAELPETAEPIGQPRATHALEFGASIESEGYNVFALGQPGSGRRSIVMDTLRRHAREMPTPSDWCYVHNFTEPRRPRAIKLPPGHAPEFRADMEELIEDVDREITRSFESDEYQQRREEVLSEYREDRSEKLQQLEREVQEKGLAIGRGPTGLIVAPAQDGEVLSPQEYQQLPPEEREEIERRRKEMQEKLEDELRRGQKLEKEARKKVAELDREVAEFAVGSLFDELKEHYAEIDSVVEYIDEVRGDVIDNVEIFRADQAAAEQHLHMMGGGHRQPPMFGPQDGLPQSPYTRYAVNVLITHTEGEGAPVEFETNPTIDNLTGEIEHLSYMGALLTDFTMIKEGALHRANGGYLVLEALALLTRPFAWEALKRALKESEVRPESVREQLRLISTVSLEPEAIPLDLKVVLIGTPMLYYLLYQHDEDFQKLFKVKADFDLIMDRGENAVQSYAHFIAACCHREGLPHFAPDAVALVAEEGARLAGDREKLTVRFLQVADLVREAAYWCRQGDSEVVSAAHVRRAVDDAIWRSNRIEQRLLELIEQGTLMVDVTGERIGQVNGIAVLPLGDYAFGKPTRITARSFLGKPGVINIDREVEMAGPIHNKATLILGGYLGEKFAQHQPLSVTATVAFEQVYEEIEGDSASAAELYALLSSIGEVPLRQDLAVTGSVNQHGEIQAIGGVNEKIEGFFHTCRLFGLTGSQGVVIPQANVRNLMLRPDVIQAIEAGEFHVYSVATVDEAIELLTGRAMGGPDDDASFPEGTVGAAVQGRLLELARRHREFRTSDDDDGGIEGDISPE